MKLVPNIWGQAEAEARRIKFGTMVLTVLVRHGEIVEAELTRVTPKWNKQDAAREQGIIV